MAKDQRQNYEYLQGTQRVCSPQETLKNISRLAKARGITRVLNVTRLDRLGIPTFCAVRPQGVVLSVSNGKGHSNDAAAVSAIMESIEVDYAEYPSISNWRLSTSEKMLIEEGMKTVDPRLLVQNCLWPPERIGGLFYSRDLVLDWVAGCELIKNEKYMIPASAIYAIPPFFHYSTSNGLASGNTCTEAILHAIFEIIERDSVASLINRPSNAPPLPLVSVELNSLPNNLQNLVLPLSHERAELILLNIPSKANTYTFWAVLYSDGEPAIHLSVFGGYGTHFNPVIAASRAITEAAQSRLTNIHGAREDLGLDRNHRQLSESEIAKRQLIRSRGREKFRGLSKVSLHELIESNPLPVQQSSIERNLEVLIQNIGNANYQQVFVHELTDTQSEISVVKVFIPGMKISPKML